MIGGSAGLPPTHAFKGRSGLNKQLVSSFQGSDKKVSQKKLEKGLK